MPQDLGRLLKGTVEHYRAVLDRDGATACLAGASNPHTTTPPCPRTLVRAGLPVPGGLVKCQGATACCVFWGGGVGTPGELGHEEASRPDDLRSPKLWDGNGVWPRGPFLCRRQDWRICYDSQVIPPRAFKPAPCQQETIELCFRDCVGGDAAGPR